MTNIFSKFNLYDQLACISVGFYQSSLLVILYAIISDDNTGGLLEFIKIEFVVWTIFGFYIIGHLVQAVSNMFDTWEKGKKKEGDKKYAFVIEKARKYFDLPDNLQDNDVWQYCYLYALSNDFSGHVVLFNSLYSLHRGFWVASSFAFALSSFLVIREAITTACMFGSNVCVDWKLLIFTLSTFAFAKIFNKRKKRFFNYTGEKMLITFDILSKAILNKR